MTMTAFRFDICFCSLRRGSHLLNKSLMNPITIAKKQIQIKDPTGIRKNHTKACSVLIAEPFRSYPNHTE